MKKSTTKRALLMSVLSMFLCFTMLIGTTFAWFTDEVKSGVNTIVAGNLDVELYNGLDDTAEKVDGMTDLFTDVKPEHWEPNAMAYENFTVSNEGNLALKYQLSLNVGEATTVDGIALTELLKVTVIPGGIADGSDRLVVADYTWQTLKSLDETGDLAAGETDTYAIVIWWEPSEFDNLFNMNNDRKGTKASVVLGVELFATQLEAEMDSFGNDYDADALACDVVATPETINEVLATVAAGTRIGLANGYYDTITLTQDDLTILTNTAVVGFLNLNAKDGATIDGVTFDETGAKETYTFKSGNVQTATGYVANITGDIDSPAAASNVTIKNCKFTNTNGVATVAATEYIPVYFNEQGAASERATDITIKDCVFECNATQYICMNYLSVGEIVIANNVFGGGAYGTSHNTINASGNAADWTITGNSFNNWNSIKTAIGSSKQGSNVVTWTVTNNEFNLVDGIVMALKTSYNADNTVIVMNNNVALNGCGSIVATDVNGENEAIFGGAKIQLNDGVTSVSSSAELKSAIANGATVYVPAGEYSLTSMNGKEGITIVGSADGSTVVGGENTSTGFGSNFGKNTTIKNVTFSGKTNGVRYSYAQGGTTVFEDCTFAGDSIYGFHIDESKGATFIFNNCTFIGFNAFASDLEKVTFNNCTFLSNGSYGHTNIWSVGEFNNCTWGEGATYGPRGDAKIYIDGVLQN